MDPAVDLAQLAAEIRACQRCPLAHTRTHAVPGEGPADAALMFIGEAPGYYEDRQGRPFVGASGRLLERLLAGIGLTREDVFITNVVKCRPPGNRDPLPEEIEACRPWLSRQIAWIDPLVIVTLGRFSMAQFFPASARITRIHGQPLWQERRAILPLFHPAAALRNPRWMEAMEADFAQIPDLLARVQARRSDSSSPQQLSLF